MSSQSASRIEEFLDSAAYRHLADEERLPKTFRANASMLPASARDIAHVEQTWFVHERLPFINYPHEWIPEQLLAACIFTLDLASTLRAAGWDIKDGNARNVVFRGSSPVFVDFGSFEPRDDSTPVWRPSGQLQRHFLLPILAYLHVGFAPSSLLLSHPDGLAHEEAYRCLSGSRFCSRDTFWLCTLPVWLARFNGESPANRSRQPNAAVCRRTADFTLASLRRRGTALLQKLRAPNSHWATYEDHRHHYSKHQLAVKRATIDRILGRLKPAWLLDIGTNGGEYAILAARHGCEVVAIDTDIDSLRAARQAAIDNGCNILPLHVDFVTPTPALGWNGAECISFDQRCAGRFDMVMALAVLHHVLAVGRIPLDEVVAKLAAYTRRHLLVEYVDPSDPMFSAIARRHGDSFSTLNQTVFVAALTRYFHVEDIIDVIPGQRVLLLCTLHGH